MKKLLNRLLNNKGMTLTELIVALFLTSVILAIAVGMLAPVKNLMGTMKRNAHMDTISATVDEYVRGSLQTAKSLEFFTLDNKNEIVEADRDNVKNFFSGNKVRALAVLNTNSDTSEEPVYRLFDLGQVAGNTELINLLGKANSAVTVTRKEMAEYAVFNEPFYEGTSCAVEFFSDGKTLQVASQCFRDGEMMNQKHVLNFKLLNSAVTVNPGGEETFADPETQTLLAGHCYLILYTVYDWT